MCGIVGIANHKDASTLAYLSLYAQQHRGQESAGIVSCENSVFHIHHSMGHVSDIFTQDVLNALKGPSAIGHVRYSTHGGSHVKNIQPFTINYARGSLAVAHNGNIVNADTIRKDLEKEGAIFQSNMDTEVIVHLLAKSKKKTGQERLIETLNKIEGAFSLLFLTEKGIIAARDPSGFRPLVLGRLENSYVVASESCAFDLIGAELVREIEPGEILFIEGEELRSVRFSDEKTAQHKCIFEYIYFARPDSLIFDKEVYEVRKGFGRQLAETAPVEADIVSPVPDSGVPAAIGYANASGIPFQMALVRNHYVGRTFIEPEQSIRNFGVKVKLNPIKTTLKDKRVILVDDSIVRGTTSRKIIKMVRDAGAAEVHMRISSPPTSWPCFYGIDTPSRGELVSSKKSLEEIREFIQADSLSYLPVDSLYWFTKTQKNTGFCDACFTGRYPIGRDEVARLIKEESGELIMAYSSAS